MASSIPSGISNVSVASLMNLAGLAAGEYDDKDDATKMTLLSIQRNVLQSRSREVQYPVHHEIAARYLPALAEKYKGDTHVLGTSALLINLVAYTPYFVRFAATDAGKDIVNLQTRRIAELTDASAATLSQDQVAEIGQFYATLLVLQGPDGIPPEEKKNVIARLSKWKLEASGFADETLERCLMGLEGSGEGEMAFIMQGVKTMLQAPLKKCAGGGTCDRTADDGQAPLLSNCSRCKVAVYCGSDHQKAAWPKHKTICYPTAF